MATVSAAWARWLLVGGFACGLAVGCEAVLGTGSLSERSPGDGGTQDATMGDGSSSGDDTGSSSGDDSGSSSGATDSGSSSGDADSGSSSGSDGGASSGADAGCTGLVCSGSCVPNDVHNCGACGHDCTNLPHVSGPVSCSTSGQCSFPASSCAPGWVHCSGNPDNGCETSATTTSNCGSCGNACSGGTPVCSGSGSSYACASGCPASTPTLCSGTCVDTTSNANDCNGCGNVCTTAVAHAQPTCVSSACSFACNGGYTDCSGACLDTTSDANNCGTCGHVCSTSVANAQPTCSNSQCSYACDQGYASCGSACVDLQSDPNNCNACGRSCNGGQCMAGVCQPYVVASPSQLGRIATDGAQVVYVDVGTDALWEVPAAGGTAIQLASAGAHDFLVVGSGKVFYGAPGTTSTLGLATIGVANSGATLNTIYGSVTGATMNPSATRYLYVVSASNGGGGASDCAIAGSPCVGAGSFSSGPMGGAGGDDNDFFYSNGTVIESEPVGTGQNSTIESRSATIDEVLGDGTYVYWAETSSTFVTTIYRTPESNPGTPTQIVSNAGSFVTDGTTVYFLSGNSVKSTAASGGASVSTVATESSSLAFIALGGKLLVWTMGNTIYGLVLP